MLVGCADAGASECPSQVEMEAGTASGCVEGTRCDYGRSCCCNACVTPLTCTCEAGRFGCVAGDLICACSPGCDVFEVATADGCTPCAVAVTAAAARFDALVGVLDRCSVDSQCVLRAGVRCAAPCVAIGASAAETFEHTVSQFESSVCRDLDSVCRVSADPVCPAGVIARCADGHCALGAPCDPAVAAVGAACDDGDPCSEGDACSADHQCVGRPVDCDDGNDCTSDDCSPDGGCAHSQRDGNCALASAACSIGGVCKAGQCAVGPPGFTTHLDGAHAYASAVAVDDTGDLVVVGATGAAPSVGALWRVAPDGATQASKALTGIERAGDVVTLAGGDLLVAGEARGASDLDVVVTRVDREGAPRWRQLIAHAGDDRRPALALGVDGQVAVVWIADDGFRMDLALTTVEGATPRVVEVGRTVLATLSWPDERPAVAAFGAGFALLRPDVDAERARAVLNVVDASGAVGADAVVRLSDGARPSGLMALGDDLVLWGSQTHATGWIRRVHTDGTTVWAHDDTRAEAAFAIDGVIAIAGGNDDWPFIATFDPTSGAEVVHLTLPSTPGPTHGVARAPAGLVLVGATPNGLAWLRRITPWSTCHGLDCTPEGCPADASAE